MRKKVWLLSFVGFLLTASPARAVIQAALDTPFDGQDVSGKAVVSGWAYAENGAPVTINLLFNNTPANVVLPCCGPRADVQAQKSGAPLNSGFGLLINYGLLDPAILNSVGVQITADGETPVTINNAVKLAKPGARSTDPTPAFFSFLDQLSLDGIRTAPDETDIIVTPVEVTDQDAGGTRQATLRLRWATNAQAFGIVAAASSTSFDNVQPIFTTRCATAQCHDNITRAGNLDLSEGRAFRRIVAVRSDQDLQERFRVNPGKALASYLYQKIIPGGEVAPATTIMPPACANTPNSCLLGSEIQAIANWINEGAPPPQEE